MVSPPFLISWNLTRRCNLRCPHCYLDADLLEGGRGDLTTDQALMVVDQLGALCPGAMLILTGGEPLLREDIWQIAESASRQRLSVVLGSNGTLLKADLVPRLVTAGFQGVGVSLDSIYPENHDRFRGLSGSWQMTMDAVDAMGRQGLEFQIQCTVTRSNYEEILPMIALAAAKGAKAVHVFFLVCTGRGQRMTDITPGQYENVLQSLAQAEQEYAGKVMVRARCAPHFLRLVANTNPDSAVLRGATSGCIAGRGYVRITPEGDITACPYMSEPSGNLLVTPLATLWEQNAVMQSLREPVYRGKCGVCSYRQVCGGCRARALSATGDLMGEDPWCEYEPDSEERDVLFPSPSGESRDGHRGTGPHVVVQWTPAAQERLQRVPFFLRSMVKSGVERYAQGKGLPTITPELMIAMRSRVHGRR